MAYGNAAGKGITAEQVVEAIENAQGYASKAAELLGIGRSTLYKYLQMKKYEAAKVALDDTREKRHDYVENKLMEQIKNNNITAIIFYLKTQCKDRGYTERYEYTGADNKPIEIKTIEVVKDYGA